MTLPKGWHLLWKPKTAEAANPEALAAKGETISVVLRIPEEAAKQVQRVQAKVFQLIPKMRDQEKVPHITLAYAKGLTDAAITQLVPKLKATMAHRSYHLTLGPIKELTNHKGELVIYLAAGHQQLTETHGKLKRLIEPAGGKYTWPDFKGHVTIGYRSNGLTDEEKGRLKLLRVSIPVTITPREVDITRKKGDDWLKLAKVNEPWIALDLQKVAEEEPFVPGSTAKCSCGYESEDASSGNELRHLVQSDGGVVRWDDQKFNALCPECGRQLEYSQ